jgi:hypothetical protein
MVNGSDGILVHSTMTSAFHAPRMAVGLRHWA